jgi:predicted RNA-binding Zn ribbon-like protein
MASDVLLVKTILVVTSTICSDGYQARTMNQINRRRIDEIEFPRLLGDRLCLDFANSVESPLEEPQEFLTDFEALARWGRHVGLLDDGQVVAGVRAERAQPDLAARLYADALDLRTSIQHAFVAIAEDGEVGDDDLAGIQQAYLQGLQQCQLLLDSGRAQWAWACSGDMSAVEYVLWRVAQSAADLLTDGDLARVKTCGCGWLFYDTSRNGSRRWCSMEGCGTQAKMRRYTAKRRAARA